MPELHLEKNKDKSPGGGETRTNTELGNFVVKDERTATVLDTSELVSGMPSILTSMEVITRKPETTEACEERHDAQEKVCSFKDLPSVPANPSFMEDSLCQGTAMEDPDGEPFSLVNCTSDEFSSFGSLTKNSNVLENKSPTSPLLNLSEENSCENFFTVITNQDTTAHEKSLLTTAQDLMGKAGDFFLKNFGANNEESTTSLHANVEDSNDTKPAKISPTVGGLKDSVVGEELVTNVDSDLIETGVGGSNSDDDSDEKYPLVLDPTFINLLYSSFGNPYEEPLYESQKLQTGSPSGVTVNIPASLARKLHECLLKSQWDSILAEDEISQKMLIEDELLARQLQELEKEDLNNEKIQKYSSSNSPNLREIMDMEMAMAMYKAEQNTVEENQRSDISTRLTWDLLLKEFPQIPHNVIAQIFSAYDYSYANTREALLTSLPEYDKDNPQYAVKDVISPEAIAAQEKALLEKAKMESLKSQQREMLLDEEEDGGDEEDSKGSWKEMVDEARKSATLNRRLQKERHAQAQAANRNGMASAAAYYWQMARLHKQKAEEESRKAANILARVFSGKYGSSEGSQVGTSTWTSPPPTLDMHSMTVAEAITVMNAFLDAHIEWLRAEKTRPNYDTSRKTGHTKIRTLFLVTGRGLNSLGGIPRIKPAVERQLEMRGIWYEEMNPGLLRVMVSANQQTKMKV